MSVSMSVCASVSLSVLKLEHIVYMKIARTSSTLVLNQSVQLK